MPLFGSITAALEEHLKQSRRARLRRRATAVIEQDRLERLTATTGWRPPGITGKEAPRHG